MGLTQLPNREKMYHVHIYQVSSLGEVNISAKNEKEAREQGMALAKEGSVSLRFPDCGQIALAWEQ